MNIKKILKDMAKYSVRGLYILGSHIIPANEKIILFESGNGRNYSGNPRYIYEEILNQGLNDEFKCVWSLIDTDIKIPGNPVKVRRSYFKFLYYTLRSGAWIFDARHLYYLRKNKKAKYVQTWHGTPLKKLALDMEYMDMNGSQDIERYHQEFRDNSLLWQYLISQNPFSSEIFRSAFDFKGEMLEIGYPRNDILINRNNAEDIDEIKGRFNIPKDKKIILYAPTWRDNQYHDNNEYKFATEMDFDKMHKELGDEYVLAIRLHPNYANFCDEEHPIDLEALCEKHDIIDFTGYKDEQKLLLLSDILIADYSSIMVDYTILKKPIILFAYDLDDYLNKERGFYFDYKENVPGKIVYDMDELIDSIKEEDFKLDKLEEFFRLQFGDFKANSSNLILDYILED